MFLLHDSVLKLNLKFIKCICLLYFYVCTMNPSFVFSGLLCVNESDVTIDYSIIFVVVVVIYLFIFSVKADSSIFLQRT